METNALLHDLIIAIREQTDAINRLADSNQALVDAMIDAEDDDHIGIQTRCLDGSLC
jgi:hypothetical protein